MVSSFRRTFRFNPLFRDVDLQDRNHAVQLGPHDRSLVPRLIANADDSWRHPFHTIESPISEGHFSHDSIGWVQTVVLEKVDGNGRRHNADCVFIPGTIR